MHSDHVTIIETNYTWNIGRLALAIFASLYFLYCARYFADWHFVDYLNLIFHEAGHTITVAFPAIINIAAGSFFQILIPLACSFYFYEQNDYYSSSLFFLWIGQNLASISNYARDAVTMSLPLISGDNSIHDWNYILSELDLLHQTSNIALFIYVTGIITIVCAGILAVFYSRENTNRNIGRTY